MSAAARRLRVVAPSTERLTREALIALDEAQAAERQARTAVGELLRQLANERKVAFIRVEAARRELLG